VKKFDEGMKSPPKGFFGKISKDQKIGTGGGLGLKRCVVEIGKTGFATLYSAGQRHHPRGKHLNSSKWRKMCEMRGTKPKRKGRNRQKIKNQRPITPICGGWGEKNRELGIYEI